MAQARESIGEPRPAGAAPLAIVLHSTVGTWDGALSWLTDPSSGVGAHWLIGRDGRIRGLVDERRLARHAGIVHEPTAELLGGPDPNAWTIGIELVDDGDPAAPRPAAQLHAARGLLREIAGRWSIPLDRRHVLAHRELRADTACPGDALDLDALVQAAAAPPRILALLPVRNGGAHLDGWLESVAPLADGALALDDGSTDDTAARLATAAPFLRVIGSNPPRPTAAGWDDLANRQRLVDAALEHWADWVVFLDADERLHPSDAAALRDFLLGGDALASCAYGLRHHRLWGGGHDPQAHHVYRVFAPRGGDRLPIGRLHRTPVPSRIPAGARLPTTIPLLHAGAIDEPGITAHVRKYAEADPEGRWPVGFGGLAGPPEQLVPGLPVRPPGVPILALPGALAAGDSVTSGSPGATDEGGALGDAIAAEERPLLAVLTPVRNAPHLLDAWLDAADRHADLVAVLDDGSTDDTAERVAGDPRIDVRAARPRRDTYAGWDDAACRQQLLDAVGELEPRWVLFLDADERLDPADWQALREALAAGELDPAAVFQLRVCRMIGDEQHYDKADLWVDRLFAWAPGLRLPAGRLHAPPAPAGRPRVRTTLRIKHLASLTAADRAARHAKYEQADPQREHQADYGALLDEPGALRRFASRPAALPVVAVDGGQGVGALDPHALDLDAPALSAIVIARDDEDWIVEAVGAVVAQEVDEPFEVIVVVSGTDRTAQLVREHFPQVQLIELGPGEVLPGRARNAGLQRARGDYVSFPGSHVVLPPGSLQARLDAHRAGHALVTGSFRNLNATPAGWASHLLDHAQALASRPSSEVDGPPGSCSYARDLLLAHGGFPEDVRAGEDTAVNVALYEAGHRAWRSQRIVLAYRPRSRTAWQLARHQWRRGRALGRLTRELAAREGAPVGRLAMARRTIRTPRARVRRVAAGVARWGDAEARAGWGRARWHALLGASVAWAAAWFDVLCGGRVRPRRS